jgi:uncharacterized membrane protein
MQDSDEKAAMRRRARMAGFVKATLFGGLIFLLPLGLIGYLVGKAVGLAVTAGEPVFRMLPHTAFWLAMIPLLALTALIVLALLAGLFARTKTGMRFLDWVETSLFGGVPQYQFMKSMAEGVAKMESGPGWQPVLVAVAAGWRIGFIVEAVNADWAAVFLPQSPSATVGEVVICPTSALRAIPDSMAHVTAMLKRMGLGSAEALQSVDLSLPGQVALPISEDVPGRDRPAV